MKEKEQIVANWLPRYTGVPLNEFGQHILLTNFGGYLDVFRRVIRRRGSSHKNTGSKGELFYFDPNSLSAEGWKKLGLRDKTINTIRNYLSKGGKFKKPEDLKKIYALFPEEYERIAGYIRIADNNTHTPNEEEFQPAANNYSTNKPRYSVIDINTADTTAFIALRGYWDKLAARIVNFRDKLGGFHSINQVAETYGLPDSTFQRIRPYLKLENNVLKKININTATVDELKAHPYIRYSIANPIIAYCNEHGPFPLPAKSLAHRPSSPAPPGSQSLP